MCSTRAQLGYRRGFAVYDEHASLKLIKKLKDKVEGGSGAALKTSQQEKAEELSAGAVQAIISAAKNDAYDAQSFRASPPRRNTDMGQQRLRLVAQVFELYQKTLRDENIIDFDDMASGLRGPNPQGCHGPPNRATATANPSAASLACQPPLQA